MHKYGMNRILAVAIIILAIALGALYLVNKNLRQEIQISEQTITDLRSDILLQSKSIEQMKTDAAIQQVLYQNYETTISDIQKQYDADTDKSINDLFGDINRETRK